MAENTNAPVSTVQNVQSNSPKKVKKTTTTKSKSTQGSTHPKYSEMIKGALKALNERSGSSRAAILKYVLANYSLDPAQANQHLKLALKNGVKAKVLKQTKGNGASGSFKLNENATKKVAKKKSTKPKKPTSTGSPTKKRSRSKSAGTKPAKKLATSTNNSAATPAADGSSIVKAKKPKVSKPKTSTTKSTSSSKVKKPKQTKPKKTTAAKPTGTKKSPTKKAAKPKTAKTTTTKKPKSTAAAKPKTSKPKAAKPKSASKKAASPKKAAK